MPRGFAGGLAVVILAMLAAGPASAQTPSQGFIYKCTDGNGRPLTSDRPIPECANREQRILNPDGSLNHVQPPTPTTEEQATIDAKERQASVEASNRRDAERRDRNLLARFPDEAAHRKARAKALDDMNSAARLSETRIASLKAERKPLNEEAEFYIGKPLPNKLKISLDANDALLAAQKSLLENQRDDVSRINARYDAELAYLRKLWAGAPVGSLGTPPGTPPPAATVSVPGSAAKPVGTRLDASSR